VTSGRAARELGRGERVVPGVWRLRLPLPWPGVPHCNAWAIAAGDGIVLVDTGMHQPGSMAHLERAMGMVHLRPELVRHVVLTHAHVDHCGQAAPIVSRSGAEVWMHPDHRHLTAFLEDAEAMWNRRLEVALQSGVPEEAALEASARRRKADTGIAGAIHVDRELTEGVTVPTDLGDFTVIETPGHAPSHVCLYNAEHRMLVSGDHLLGRVSPYFEVGFSPDPVGEFLASLDRVEALDARLVLAGHGRTFTDVEGHVRATRQEIRRRLDRLEQALEGTTEPRTAFELAPDVFETPLTQQNGSWLLSETLALLIHARRVGRIEKVDREPDRFRLA
jgi:glyoxylase-like metal-dependent hydrolase (beta-lactamase superfamily II)